MIVLLKMPQRYCMKDATPEDKEVYEYYKEQIRKIADGEVKSLIMPSVFDPETRQPLFDIQFIQQPKEEV